VSAIDVGRVCVKTAGRDAGKNCIIVDVLDRNFVLVTGPEALTGVRRRRVNVKHLEPTSEQIKLKRGATDEEVMTALGKKGVEKKVPEKKRRPARVRRARGST